MGRKTLLLFFLIIILIILIIPNSIATTAEVDISLAQHEIEFIYQDNASFEIKIQGNVSCKMEGIGKDYQYIEVKLVASDDCSWERIISPSSLEFSTDGFQNFNLTILIPESVSNRTTNTMILWGYWSTEPYGGLITGNSGEALPDQVNISVLRTTPVLSPDIEYGSDIDRRDPYELYKWPIVLFLVIILMIVIGVILFYFKNIRYR